VVRLDDFYRDGEDPTLPTRFLGETAIIDWDDPRSWDATRAVTALRQLVTSGAVDVPCYDISRSHATGSVRVDAEPGALILAEGIFAAEIIGDLRANGLLHSAWCVRHRRAITFVRRLIRDLAERRKPPSVLLRRGLSLYRLEPSVLARMESLGAVCATPAEAYRVLTHLPAGAAGTR
jgi:uridine kinase